MNNFEDFYEDLVSEEETMRPIFHGSSSIVESTKILDKVYLKEVCNFIYEHGTSAYNKGYAEALIKYLVDGSIKLCSMKEFLFTNPSKTAENMFYADIMHNRKLSIANYFGSSSIATFFTDLVTLSKGNQLNCSYTNIIDFNLMYHIYIMKTRRLKNNSNIWNGIDISNCPEYSPATRIGFNVFRYQYNQQITNEIRGLLRMCINCMSINAPKGIENKASLGIMDLVSLDMLHSKYRFDNSSGIVEPNIEELYKHNAKILREFEMRSKPDNPKNYILPKLRVYLCSSLSIEYLVTKHMSWFLHMSFDEVHNMFSAISNWDNEVEVTDKIRKITGKHKRALEHPKRYEEELKNAFKVAHYYDKFSVIDKELLELCQQFYIPNMEFVVYTWNNNVFEPTSSEVEIDFKKALDKVGAEDVMSYLQQLYVAGQSINLMKRLVVDDKNFLKVIVKNVPAEYALDVDKLLYKETKDLTTEYSDKFSYMYILDNTCDLETAFYNIKNGKNKKRDGFLSKYKKHCSKSTLYPSGKRVSHFKYDSVIHSQTGKRWNVVKGKIHTGRYKIMQELSKNMEYYKNHEED